MAINTTRDTSEIQIDSCIRGYHVYQTIWAPTIGEELNCRREMANIVDRYAIGVCKLDDTLVGHLPRKITTICLLFLRHGGLISCRVTGRRRRSTDLPQGGLEIPCVLTFKGRNKDIKKLRTKFDK